jgi:hypothetical protein
MSQRDDPQKVKAFSAEADRDSDGQSERTRFATRSTGRTWLLRIFSLTLGLVFAVLIAEIVARVAGIEPPRALSKRQLMERSNQSTVYHCYPSNPSGELAPLPDTTRGDWQLKTYGFVPTQLPLDQVSETPWCVQYNYSSKLIRDREYPLDPPQGVQRWVCIGDSFVFGEGVPEQLSLPRQLESMLGKGHEMMNAGVVGFNTQEEVGVLRKVTEEAHCSRAVFVFIANDILLTPRLEYQQKYINDLILLRDSRLETFESESWYTGHLKVLHLAGGNLAMQRIKRQTIQWYLDSYDAAHNQANLQTLRQNIRSLSEVADCRVAFVLYPLMEGFENGYPLTAVHQTVAEFARDAGLPVLDLAEAFAGMDADELTVHPTDHHPNGKAHTIAARAITDWLRNVPGFLDDQKPAHDARSGADH